jgi:magnesium transporter
VQKDLTVHKAIEKIRKRSEEYSSIYHVFVVDDDNRLEGIVSVRTLLLSKKDQKIADLMTRVYRTVRVHTKVEEVARVVTKYNLMSVAVVDKKKVMHGVIAVDDILRFLIPDA